MSILSKFKMVWSTHRVYQVFSVFVLFILYINLFHKVGNFINVLFFILPVVWFFYTLVLFEQQNKQALTSNATASSATQVAATKPQPGRTMVLLLNPKIKFGVSILAGALYALPYIKIALFAEVACMLKWVMPVAQLILGVAIALGILNVITLKYDVTGNKHFFTKLLGTLITVAGIWFLTVVFVVFSSDSC